MSLIRIICISLLLTAFSNQDFNKNNAEFIKLLKDTKITVVAPASGISKELLADLKHINSLKLYIPDHCFDGGKSQFHSHCNETRYKCLENALVDNSNNIIWALRGGYGSAKLINNLQKLQKPTKEKIFIGFSDMTALHIFLSQEWGWKTIHGNGIVEILKADKDRENFIKIAKIISGEATESVVKGLSAINPSAESGKSVTGSLTGGNLTIVQTSLGTNWQIKTSDKIIFLEDVDIKAYQLDRSLYHLKQAGVFNNINAIIFGVCGNDGNDIMKVLKDFASHLTIPVFKSNRFGHEKFNDPIIYNTPSKIIPSSNGKFDLTMKL